MTSSPLPPSASPQPLRVLVVEDDPADAELLELELLRGGFAPKIHRVQTAETMQQALDSAEWDLVLCDYMMPRFNGLRALELLKATGKDIPFILISATVGDDVAVKAMSAGAQDVFIKGKLALLVPAIQRELREAEFRSTARAQRERMQQNEKLAAMGTLLAGVAHELNNPLTVIMHQATLLQRSLANDPRQARSDKILLAVRNCSRIIENFLALARHEPPKRGAVSVNQIIEAAMDLVSYGLRIDDIDLSIELTEPAPMVMADLHQLQQVIINLVGNAQYALRGRTDHRLLKVYTEIDGDGANVLLKIVDNGGGIPPEIRSRIFDPFFTTKPVGKGTGLGLALCHGIVTSHNGTISVESEPNVGTTFIISLPIALTTATGDLPSTAEDGRAMVASQRILVVDDEPDVASALSDILTAQGHRVNVAGDGRSALQLLDKGVYDIVVSDMRMPEFDGPALYRAVVARHPLLEHSFVFITGDTFSADTEAFLHDTGAVYLNKPCTYDDIDGAVQRVMQRRTTS
jgi:signal transduction histidine kinase